MPSGKARASQGLCGCEGSFAEPEDVEREEPEEVEPEEPEEVEPEDVEPEEREDVEPEEPEEEGPILNGFVPSEPEPEFAEFE